MIYGFVILFAFLLVGEAITYLLEIPIHGAAIGMLLMTIWLVVRGKISDELASASHQLISSLTLFMVPGVVGVFFLADKFEGEWFTIILALAGGTFLSVFTSLLLVKFGRLESSND